MYEYEYERKVTSYLKELQTLYLYAWVSNMYIKKDVKQQLML